MNVSEAMFMTLILFLMSVWLISYGDGLSSGSQSLSILLLGGGCLCLLISFISFLYTMHIALSVAIEKNDRGQLY
jgi:hypothetical protein